MCVSVGVCVYERVHDSVSERWCTSLQVMCCCVCACACMCEDGRTHVHSYIYIYIYIIIPVCVYVCTLAVFSTLIGEHSTFLPSSLFCVGFDTSKQ